MNQLPLHHGTLKTHLEENGSEHEENSQDPMGSFGRDRDHLSTTHGAWADFPGRATGAVQGGVLNDRDPGERML